MKKLSIKDVIDFKRRSDRGKRNFVVDIKLNQEEADADGGGNYWVSAISAVSNSFKLNNLQPLFDKRDELEEKYDETDNKTTKERWARNIDILSVCEELGLDKWRPQEDIKFIRKIKDHSALIIKGLEIKVDPHHIFTFEKNNNEEIGAIWFIAKKDGLKKEELGMFTDILYRYLDIHFSERYIINSEHCIAVDVVKGIDVNYLQLEKGKTPMILDSTIHEIKKLMLN